MKKDRKLRSGLGPEDAEPETGERAVRALDYHLELLSWLETAEALELYTAVAGEQWGIERGGDRLIKDRLEVSLAPTYFITGEMGRVTKMASDSLPVGGAVLPQDLPSRRGFAYFASGIKFPEYGAGADGAWDDLTAEERRDEPAFSMAVTVRAISWWWHDRIAWVTDGKKVREAPGVSYTLWCNGIDIFDAYDETYQALRKLTTPDKMPPSPPRDQWRTRRFVPFEFSSWSFGHEYTTDDSVKLGRQLRSGEVHPAVDWQRRFMLALWSLMGQEVAVVRPVHLKRPEERRKLRMQAKFPEFGDLKIVRLRRQYNPILELAEPEEGLSVGPAREWTHRWWVRDHWAWRACGEGRTERRRVWIAPYIKGPEDKPLIEKDIIFSLER